MARPWIRLYTEVPNDPKVQRLSPMLFKFWVNCLCLAGANDGILPEAADLAWSLKIKPIQADGFVRELVEAGLLDRHGDDFVPHGWEDRQFESDTSRERQRKYRERTRRHADGESDVTVTAQEQNRTDTDQKQNRTEVFPSPKRNENWQRDPDFCAFRDAYLSTGAVAIETDWPKAFSVWRLLDMDQKAQANKHVTGCSPQFMKQPQNYLADREFNRPQRPELLKKSKLEQAFEEAAKL